MNRNFPVEYIYINVIGNNMLDTNYSIIIIICNIATSSVLLRLRRLSVFFLSLRRGLRSSSDLFFGDFYNCNYSSVNLINDINGENKPYL